MARKFWRDLIPSLLLAAGIVASTFIAVRASETGWVVLLAPLVLAVAVLGADALDSRLHEKSPLPSWAALILAGAIMTLRDPSLFKTFGPIIGAAGYGALFIRAKGARKRCGDL